MNSIEPNIRTLANALSRGTMSCEQLLTQCLERAKASEGVFTFIDDSVLEQARTIDQARQKETLSPLAGLPVTVKDLFNVKGQKTLAGSIVLRHSAIEQDRDCVVVDNLRQAGMLFPGRTNMSEFAFSGMGLNPHHPPLYSVWDRETKRLPGGSSSGSAVSVALGIVAATLGSDTGGSCRVPAAFNGIVGMKPSYGRLSLQGVYPLSPTSDTPGPLAVDVDSCFLIDHVMSGAFNGTLPTLKPAAAGSMRLLIPDSAVMQDLDPEVEAAFQKAVVNLQAAGIQVNRQPMTVMDDCVEMFFTRPIAVYESWLHHREMLAQWGDEYDPFVFHRISTGRKLTAREQQERYTLKAGLTTRFKQQFSEAGVDAVLYPTAACIPPAVAETTDPDKIGGVNLRCLRNTSTANNFDGCSISLPCHNSGEAPVGLMLSCPHGEDEKLLQLAATVESILARPGAN